MNSERIKEIQEQTAYPESVSVMLALKQVWNECEQERLLIQRVSKRSICGCGNPKVEHSCKNCKGQIKHS